LVKLLVEMGVIDGLNASQLYTEEHIEKILIPTFRKEGEPSKKMEEKDTGKSGPLGSKKTKRKYCDDCSGNDHPIGDYCVGCDMTEYRRSKE